MLLFSVSIQFEIIDVARVGSQCRIAYSMHIKSNAFKSMSFAYLKYVEGDGLTGFSWVLPLVPNEVNLTGAP